MFYTYRQIVFQGLIPSRSSHIRSEAVQLRLPQFTCHPCYLLIYTISGTSLRVPILSTAAPSSGLCYKLGSSESMSTWQCGIKYISDQYRSIPNLVDFPIGSTMQNLCLRKVLSSSTLVLQIQRWLYIQLSHDETMNSFSQAMNNIESRNCDLTSYQTFPSLQPS